MHPENPAAAAAPEAPSRAQPSGPPMAGTRAAAFAPASFDEKRLTVDLVWTTGAAVERRSWDGEGWVEELSLDESAVDLSRLNAGAPLLNTHGSWELRDQIGVVVDGSVSIDGGAGRATVQFSRREDVAGIVQDVRDGVVRNVSVGYSVQEWTDVTPPDQKKRVWRATKWQPYELSLVPVPADPGAQTRAAPVPAPADGERTATPAASKPLQSGESTMTEEEIRAAREAAEKKAREEATAAERARTAEIREIARKASLDDEFVRKHTDEGTAVDQVRAAAIDAVAARSLKEAPEIRNTVTAGRDKRDFVRAGVESALLHRHSPSAYKLDDNARQYVGFSLIELARMACEVEGIRTSGMSKMAVAERALHSTSDFPLILANVANKTLRAAYEAYNQTFRPFVRVVTLADFKTVSRTQLGDAPQLLRVAEGAEIQRGTIGEAREQYALATYARVVAVTRQTLVNDDLDAFTRIPAMFGTMAANLESDLVYGQITSNPTMGDGLALFVAGHNNLGTGVINVDNLGAGRAAMRKQVGLNGSPINVSARYLLVSPDRETVAQQFTSSAYVPNQSSTINPFTTLTPIAEPRLTNAAQWYLIGDPSQIDTIELAYLEGQQGVYLETRNGFDVDGVEIKTRLDAATKVIDWRGFYRSSGA